MLLAITCDPQVSIKPLLEQLDKESIVYELRETGDRSELWVADANLVEPINQVYLQLVNQSESTLNLVNIKKTPVTAFILALTLLTALVTQLGSQFLQGFLIAEIQYYPRDWFLYGGVENIWRSISPMFLHFTIEHLVFNFISFWYLGSLIERKTSLLNFVLLVLVTSVASNYSQLLASGPLFGGLSGVVYGFIGFSFLFQRYVSNLMIPKGLFYLAGIWLVLGMSNVLTMIGLGSIANVAHVSGLITGCVMFLIFKLFQHIKGNV